MGRVKTFTNGGSLLPGDLNSIEDDYEFAFGTYKELTALAGAVVSGGAGAGTFGLPIISGGAGPSSFGSISSIVSAGMVVWLDLADRLATPRTTKYRLRVTAATNAVAPAITFTLGLYPVTLSYGASGLTTTGTLGAVVAGSTVAFATPGASATTGPTTSGDFTAPGAGWYAMGVVLSGNPAANSKTEFAYHLQYRQV